MSPSPRQRQILRLLATLSPLPTRTVARALGISRECASAHLYQLQQAGLIRARPSIARDAYEAGRAMPAYELVPQPGVLKEEVAA